MLHTIPERIPVICSAEAADHADRLRLLKHDIYLVELAVEMALKDAGFKVRSRD